MTSFLQISLPQNQNNRLSNEYYIPENYELIESLPIEYSDKYVNRNGVLMRQIKRNSKIHEILKTNIAPIQNGEVKLIVDIWKRKYWTYRKLILGYNPHTDVRYFSRVAFEYYFDHRYHITNVYESYNIDTNSEYDYENYYEPSTDEDDEDSSECSDNQKTKKNKL